MPLHAVRTLWVPTVNQYFLFMSGRSQMVVESMHAKIEKYSSNVVVFDPAGWYTVACILPHHSTEKWTAYTFVIR
jgi:hypothetical protein